MYGKQWLCVLLFLMIPNAYAGLDLTVPEQARVVYQTQVEAPDYPLVLGTYRRINNEWRIRNESRITGVLLSKTLEFPRNSSESQIFVTLRDSIPAEHRRELFSCKGILCGSSNAWANTHFKKSTLYGLDANQSYGVYESVDESNQRIFTVIYTVKRGNGSVFAQLDRLQALGESGQALVTPANSIANAIAETGGFSIPLIASGDSWQVKAEQARALVDFLNDHAGQKFVLVGHWNSPGQASIARSEALAESVRAALVERGVKQVPGIFAVGNRAPAGRTNTPGRVVLVRD